MMAALKYDFKIEVLSARNLIAVNNDGTSDPFVTVQLMVFDSSRRLKAYGTPWKKAQSTKVSCSPASRSK